MKISNVITFVKNVQSQIAAGAGQQGGGKRAGSSTTSRPRDDESGRSGRLDSENDQEEINDDDIPGY